MHLVFHVFKVRQRKIKLNTKKDKYGFKRRRTMKHSNQKPLQKKTSTSGKAGGESVALGHLITVVIERQNEV